MTPGVAFLLLLLASAAGAWLARLGLRALEEDGETLRRVPWTRLFLISAAASCLALAVMARPGSLPLVAPALVGQLVMAGWIDRQTTWVPDGVLGVILFLAAVHALGQTALPAAFAPLAPERAVLALAGLCAALLAWLGGLAIWAVQARLDRILLTPPDLVALLLPLVLLGPGLAAALVYGAVSLLALAILHSPRLRRIATHERALAEGSRDLGLAPDRPAIALLPLMHLLLAPALVFETRLESLFAGIVA